MATDIKNAEMFRDLIKKNKPNLDKNDKKKRKKTIQKIKDELKSACKAKDLEEIDSNEEFKFACYVGSWRKYAYYMGNGNHLIVIKKGEGMNFNEIKNPLTYKEILEQKYNHEILELSNGYIKTKFSTKFEDVEYSTDTDIYKYVEIAGWLKQEDYDAALLLRADEYDRIEIHHLNGDSSDNSVSNLIYIPNTIHCYIHANKKANL